MKNINFIVILKLLLIVLIFLAGMHFYTKINRSGSLIEGLTSGQRCPDVLIQKGDKFYLYNSKLVEVPGVNPVQFNSLEEYAEFLQWQQSSGIHCPVMYVQNTYDAQGERVYKVRPSATDPQGGLPPAKAVQDTLLVDATRNDMSFNYDSYPAYDQTSYYVGTSTPLDKMDEQKASMLYSDNPMDPNWGGAGYTQALVDSGYYSANEVKMYNTQ